MLVQQRKKQSAHSTVVNGFAEGSEDGEGDIDSEEEGRYEVQRMPLLSMTRFV